MHAQKHEVLSQLDPALRARLQAAAVAHAVTVDDVVRAGLHRARVPEAADRAAARVEKEVPGSFARLEEWPEQCPFCLDVLSAAPEACAFCPAVGCDECVKGAGCPVCQGKAREAQAAAVVARNARDRAARAAKLQTEGATAAA